ncbi:LacI family DNA-binding transcriptional regulator [Bordetella muralis]|uniref:LacI family DNA-binding transcriptional regulator n=1 Tax=Bordetella muralis TaxID=1649130 RepID=UPI0039EFCFAF
MSKTTTRVGRRSGGGVTLTDVARQAGVSVMTASRALNQPHLVSDDTRQQVLEAVANSGYVPNLHAAGLRSKRTRMIALMVPSIASGSAFLLAVHAMTEILVEAGYQVMLSERGYDRSRDDMVLDSVIARRPDGIVLTGLMESPRARQRLTASGIPVVETWEMTDTPIDMLVGFSHYDVGVAIARYFHEQGRRRVASIAATEARTAARFHGFADEALRLGIAGRHLQEGSSFVIEPPSQLGHGRSGLVCALEGDPDVDAIFSATDMVALGTLMEAQMRGLRVPEDLAVVGFGDFDFACNVTPALTTVRVDHEDIGRRTASMLINRIEGIAPDNPIQDVGFKLVQRESG